MKSVPDTLDRLHAQHFGSALERETARKLSEEKARANADMAYRLANLRMPSDIRERARVWGMEAWAEVLWNNAFQAGWRECLRAAEDDRRQAEKDAPK